jgi:hypothetical protein
MSLSAVWSQVVALLEDNISVIPIRDKDEKVGSKVLTKKSPYDKWTENQSRRNTKEELWYKMEHYNTEAIATLCGKISGNLEAIDIDVKFKEGISKAVFEAIGAYDKELLKSMRIHKTPSGGYHILYRVDGEVPPSKKIAGRNSTQEELAENPKGKFKYFIETRGEAGYVAAPPSFGYVIVQANPLPVLRMDQRDAIINICSLFNEIVKEDSNYNPLQKTDSEYYDINPFADYNRRDGENTLIDCGWSKHSTSSKAICFTKPGSKSGGIHAAFLFDKRLYWFFTTETELQDGRCYNPATVLAILKYGGDKALLRKELVSKGYGKLKPQVEKRIIQKAVLIGEELPGNLTHEAQEAYIALKQIDKNSYRFWKLDDKMKPVIDREDFYEVAAELGFRLHLGDLVRIVDTWIHRIDQRLFFDEMKKTIEYPIDLEMEQEVKNEYEAFIQRSGEFSIGRIKLLDQEIVLNDTKDCAYKFYKNGYKCVKADDVQFMPYVAEMGLVWAERVQQRDYIVGDAGGKYVEFLELALRLSENSEYLKRCIGYLAHEYKDSATSYIIALVEETPDPKLGGGSGKNVFSNLFKLTTTMTNKPGAQVKFDEKFFQSWNHERIFCISDLPKNFDFIFLKEPSSGDIVLKKLYKDEVIVPCKDAPKFLLQTNYGIDIKDGGMKRRIKQIEFTDHFTNCGGVDIHFGGMFPDDWNKEDWIGYDNFIDHCLQVWFKSGRKIEKRELSEGGWLKQFDQTYGSLTRQFIEERWDEWVKNEYTEKDAFRNQYDKFCQQNNIKYSKSLNGLYDAMRSWAEKYNFEFDPSLQKKINGINDRRIFICQKTPF